MPERRINYRVWFVTTVLVAAMALGCEGLATDLSDHRPPGEQNSAANQNNGENQHDGEFDLETIDVGDIDATAATFEAKFSELPAADVTDHGFCWSQDASPTDETGECASLGSTEQRGEFSHRVETLEPGRIYFVRAFAVVEGDDEYANELEFTTQAPAVTGVAADQGEHPSHVEVRWDEMPGATGYRVYRDGDDIAEPGAEDGGSYVDDGVEEVQLPAPEGVEVSEENREYVELQWADVESGALEAESYDYEVRALYPDVESEASDGVEGYPAVPVVGGYEVEVNDGVWIEVGEEPTYQDEDAPKGTFEIEDEPELVASQEQFLDYVEVTAWPEAFEVVLVEPAEASYRVRAVSEQGEPGEASDGVIGRRQIEYEEWRVHWQSAPSETGSFDTLSTEDYHEFVDVATAEGFVTYEDGDAPADGREMYYRLVLQAAGVETLEFGPVRGFRAVRYVVASDIKGNVKVIDGDGEVVWSGELGNETMTTSKVVVDDEGMFYLLMVYGGGEGNPTGWSLENRDIEDPDNVNEDENWIYEYDLDPESGNSVRVGGMTLWEVEFGDTGLVAVGYNIIDENYNVEERNIEFVSREFGDYLGEESFSGLEADQWIFGMTAHADLGIYLATSDDGGGAGDVISYEFGQSRWTRSFSDSGIGAVAVDTDGVVYAAGRYKVYRLDDTSGGEDAPEPEIYYDPATLFPDMQPSLVTGPGGEVYLSRGNHVMRIDGSGQYQWMFSEHEAKVWQLAVDEWKNVYTASGTIQEDGEDDNSVRRIDDDGDQVWQVDFDYPVTSVAVQPGVFSALSSDEEE